MKVSKEEFNILRHSLGLNYGKKEYRNHFCTGEGSADYPHCESLVLKGFMSKRKDPFNEVHVQYIYHVTEEGRQIARRPTKLPTTACMRN